MITETKLIHATDCKCFFWKPIFAGALMAIGLTFILNLFMVAIGVTAFTTNSDGIEKLAFSGLIATGFGVVVCMFASGWVAGYLGKSYCVKRHLGALYGFLTWCVALIVTIFLMERAQEYVSFYGHFLSGTTSTMKATASNGAIAAAVTTNLPPKTLVISAYIVFVLFFLSAFASGLGGHCGMRHRCKYENGSC